MNKEHKEHEHKQHEVHHKIKPEHEAEAKVEPENDYAWFCDSSGQCTRKPVQGE